MIRNNFLDIAIQAAKASGRIQKQYLSRDYQVRFKGTSTNLVTEVDLLCEKKIILTLGKHFPEHGFYAEEGGQTQSSSRYRWIIDPLDGTTNYAHGYPCFCTSIALEESGKIVLGVIYEPMLKELFTARKGRGAFMNGQRISPSKRSELDQSLLVTGFPYHIKKSKQNLKEFRAFSLRAQAVRRDGSAALDLCYTAMGRFDGFWEYSLSPWDLAAGSLILKEAGGKITLSNGKPFSIYKGDVLASNGLIHSEMVEILKR